MNISAQKTGLGKAKLGFILRMLIIGVVVIALLFPAIGYTSAKNDYYSKIPMRRERLDEVPIIYRRVIKAVPDVDDDNPDDWDNDGLTNDEEIKYHTNPNHNDSRLF